MGSLTINGDKKVETKLANYIQPKYFWLKFIPLLSNNIANSIYPFIFLPKEVFDNLKTNRPNPYYIALLIHEEKHRERQKQKLFSFWIKYLLSSSFRFAEELIAVKTGIKYLKENNIPFYFNDKNKKELKCLYFWPISRYYNMENLKKLWNET